MAYIYDLTDTWNASGTTFNGIKLNVTDSASASSSKLVTLQTNGTEHFSITKAGVGYVSGNLGVGTSSPTAGYRLQINAGTSAAMISSTTTSAGAIPKLTFLHAGNDEFSIVGGSYFAFLSSGTTERMRITSSGNVGIGTSSPSSKLDVNGVITGGNGTIQTVISYLASAGVTGTLSNHPYVFYANNAERARFTTDGRFFIGATSGVGNDQMLIAFNSSGAVTQALNMRDNNASGNGNSFLVLRRSDDTYLGSIGRSGTDTAMFVDGNSYLTFRTGGTERARIDSSGRVLIGTTATVGGTWSNEVKQTSSGVWPWGLNCVDRGLIVRNSSTSTGYYAYFEYNGGTNNGSISWSGGTTAYNTTSDARIKDNIVDAPDAGDLIDAIQVRSWDFKADGAHWRYGMVAQELLEVAPEAVNKPEDEEMMMGVDYSKLVPMLIKEVQSLRARVAQLEGN